LRILHQLDKNAVKTWVESVVRPDDPKIKQWYDSLRELENGEAYIWHPEKPPIFKRIIFRKRQTLHATREYFRHVQADKVEKLDVSEFIEKFRNVFEPKPKPPLAVASKPAEHIETAIHELKPVHPGPPARASRGPTNQLPGPQESANSAPGTLAEQTVPNFTLVKNKPTFQVPAEMLDDPPTPLARVLVILTNHEGRDDRWTGAKIKKLVRDHAWPEEDADQAIDQLIRAETLRKQSNNYLRFYRDQVRLVERTYEVPA
jgi:hypothetical protein